MNSLRMVIEPEFTIHDQHLRSNAAHGQLTLAAARYIHLITITRLYTRNRLCAQLYAPQNINSDSKKKKKKPLFH
jgi:hypothetical protein